MTGVYWNDLRRVRLARYSASMSSRAKGADVTLVKIELEVTDAFDLGDLLRQLADIRQEQEIAAGPKKRGAKKPLLLTYDPDGAA